jgi:signal transduction histidine kinase
VIAFSPGGEPAGVRGGPAALGGKFAFLGIAGMVACAVTTTLSLSGSEGSGQQLLIALGNALTVAVPIVAGMYAWYARPQSRFGPLLVATGFGWSLATFAQSDGSFLYSLGRVSIWLIEPVVLYLILAFPSGRLTTRIDRALVLSSLAIVAVLFVPTAFLVESYPRFSPLSGCETSCPDNFFRLADETPGFVDGAQIAREILITLVFLAAAARLFDRIRQATPLLRRTVTPVLTAAIVRLGAFGAFFIARRAVPGSFVLDAIGWLWLLTLPGIALGFLVGLLRWRLHVADAMEQLARSVIARPGRADVRDAMAAALEDPSLQVAYRVSADGGRWSGSDGAEVDVERPGPGRAVTRLSDNGRAAMALVHDAGLEEHQDFLHAAGSMAFFSTENERLTARLRVSLRELEESRARIVAAADRERRRIERDLHDGAQQRMVALRIKLELADELMEADPTHAHKLLREAESGIEEALDEVRSLARGIYPSLLADLGLAEALKAAALRAPLSTTVECDGVSRYPAAVESAVYFSCLEALQNAAKHAHEATEVKISISGNGSLEFEVRDDGDGFDISDRAPGQGLTNMRDRLATVGGSLAVGSTPGGGTVVRGTVPISAPGGRFPRTPGEADTPSDSHARRLAPAAESGDDAGRELNSTTKWR